MSVGKVHNKGTCVHTFKLYVGIIRMYVHII